MPIIPPTVWMLIRSLPGCDWLGNIENYSTAQRPQPMDCMNVDAVPSRRCPRLVDPMDLDTESWERRLQSRRDK